MGNQRMGISCYSCGKSVECCTEEAPCEVLQGWLIVAHCKGAGSFERYHFCSFSCLKSWADAQIPQVPEVFLESFKEDGS